jgi:carbamoyltransferase
LAKKLVKSHGVDNLCVAGGVGLNCKMNGEILRQSGCKNIFVQPASGDSGTSLGAAMYVSQQLGYNVATSLPHVYYGPRFSDSEIHAFLENCRVQFEAVDDPAATAAELLEQGKIVGWFQGCMEFGPRALGGRSILANPLMPEARDKVNANVKYRESWRPFCPSMLEEAKDKYLKDVNEASFMIVAYQANETAKSELPAVVHVDGTVRPQIVTEQANPLYYRLLENFAKRAGAPVVLNTSFNVRGEPIVCAPQEALRCYFSTGMDALVMGGFLLKK